MGRNESRKMVCDEMNLSPRYLANIENNGQHPSLQIFYELVTRYDLSVDEFFFPDKSSTKTAERHYLDTDRSGLRWLYNLRSYYSPAVCGLHSFSAA